MQPWSAQLSRFHPETLSVSSPEISRVNGISYDGFSIFVIQTSGAYLATYGAQSMGGSIGLSINSVTLNDSIISMPPTGGSYTSAQIVVNLNAGDVVQLVNASGGFIVVGLPIGNAASLTLVRISN